MPDYFPQNKFIKWNNVSKQYFSYLKIYPLVSNYFKFQIFPNDFPFFDSSTRPFFDLCNLFRSLGNTNNDQIDHETLNLFS